MKLKSQQDIRAENIVVKGAFAPPLKNNNGDVKPHSKLVSHFYHVFSPLFTAPRFTIHRTTISIKNKTIILITKQYMCTSLHIVYTSQQTVWNNVEKSRQTYFWKLSAYTVLKMQHWYARLGWTMRTHGQMCPQCVQCVAPLLCRPSEDYYLNY